MGNGNGPTPTTSGQESPPGVKGKVDMGNNGPSDRSDTLKGHPATRIDRDCNKRNASDTKSITTRKENEPNLQQHIPITSEIDKIQISIERPQLKGQSAECGLGDLAAIWETNFPQSSIVLCTCSSSHDCTLIVDRFEHLYAMVQHTQPRMHYVGLHCYTPHVVSWHHST